MLTQAQACENHIQRQHFYLIFKPERGCIDANVYSRQKVAMNRREP